MQFHPLTLPCWVKTEIEKHPIWILLSWSLFEIVDTGSGKFYIHYHICAIPVVFVYFSVRTIQTMFISKLYVILQYTYCLITLSLIFTNFSCVVVSQLIKWNIFILGEIILGTRKSITRASKTNQMWLPS